MSNAIENLPDDPAFLKAMIAALQTQNAKMSVTLQAHDQLIQSLRLRIARLKKQVFGKSSEKIEREIQQLELALEDLMIAASESSIEPLAEVEEAEPTEPVASTPEKTMRRRPRVSDKAARERRELDPGTHCPACGGELRLVGEDVSKILDMIAAQMKVVEIIRLKKSCRCCEKMVQLPAPSRPIPGSMAGAGLLAYILVSKFDVHLPLYRLNEIFARMGVDIPDSTLVDWCGRAMRCFALFNDQPIVMAMTPIQTMMIAITLIAAAINLNDGQTNAIEGMTHFVLFATFLALSFLGVAGGGDAIETEITLEAN